MRLEHSLLVETLELNASLIAEWDRPYYGDLDARIDWLFDEVEKIRSALAKADARLKQAGLRSRPENDRRLYRRQITEYPKKGA